MSIFNGTYSHMEYYDEWYFALEMGHVHPEHQLNINHGRST